jgi:hypothetical protein
MKELFRTSNLVYLSFAQAVLNDAGIATTVFDGDMSIQNGSLGMLLPRLMVVSDDDEVIARRLLAEAEAEAAKDAEAADDAL